MGENGLRQVTQHLYSIFTELEFIRPSGNMSVLLLLKLILDVIMLSDLRLKCRWRKDASAKNAKIWTHNKQIFET